MQLIFFFPVFSNVYVTVRDSILIKETNQANTICDYKVELFNAQSIIDSARVTCMNILFALLMLQLLSVMVLQYFRP